MVCASRQVRLHGLFPHCLLKPGETLMPPPPVTHYNKNPPVHHALTYLRTLAKSFNVWQKTLPQSYFSYDSENLFHTIYALRIRKAYKDLQNLTCSEVLDSGVTYILLKKNQEYYIGYHPVSPFINKRIIKMARSSKSDSVNAWELIACTITDSMLPDYQKWRITQEKQGLEPLSELLGNAYKVSLVFVDESSALCCSVTGTKDSVNSGKTITTWAENYVDAYWMSLYKVEVIFKNGVWSGVKQPRFG